MGPWSWVALRLQRWGQEGGATEHAGSAADREAGVPGEPALHHTQSGNRAPVRASLDRHAKENMFSFNLLFPENLLSLVSPCDMSSDCSLTHRPLMAGIT